MKWNSWVIQYDGETQLNLVRKAARTRLSLRRPSAGGTLLFAALALAAGSLWILRRRRA